MHQRNRQGSYPARKAKEKELKNKIKALNKYSKLHRSRLQYYDRKLRCELLRDGYVLLGKRAVLPQQAQN